MIKSAAITNIGLVRKMNQDSYLVSDNAVGKLPNLYIVADGMGGHKAGDYASRFVVEHIEELIRDSGEKLPEKILETSVQSLNRQLYSLASSREEYNGMGTTLVGAVVLGKTLLAVNVGDSRLYLWRNGKIRQITEDHSLVQEMISRGGLDEKRARKHPDKNIITRAVGVDARVRADFFTEELAEGDMLLLCSDGLTNMVENERIEEILSDNLTIDEKTRFLVNEANRGGGKDNTTVLLIDPFYRI